MSDSRVIAPQARSRLRMSRRDESGAALVEFALVVGIFMLVLYGLVSFGMILATKQRITNAAAEAARSAVGAPDPVAAATARVTQLLGPAAPVGGYTPSYVTGICSAPNTGQCITVSIVWDWAGHPIVPHAPGLGLVTPPTFASSAVVQYQ